MNSKIKITNIAAYSFTAIIIGISSYWAYNFLNENFYQAFSQSNEVISLQKNIPIGSIDIKNFTVVLENLKTKNRGYTDEENIKNPFKD